MRKPRHILQFRRRRSFLLILSVATIVASLILAVSLVQTAQREKPPPASSTGTAAPMQPVSTHGSPMHLTAPDRAQVGRLTFTAKKGEHRVVSALTEATVSIPDGPKDAVYAVVGLSCAPAGGDPERDAVDSITENLTRGTTRQLSSSLLYTVPVSGTQFCTTTFEAPKWDYGTIRPTVSLHGSLQASEASEQAVEIDASQRSPIVVPEGRTETVLSHELPTPTESGSHSVSVLSSAHLTTCTIRNGSRDFTDERLCRAQTLDEGGSRVRVVSRVQMLHGSHVCRSATVLDETLLIDATTHHKSLGDELDLSTFLDNACGDTVRISLYVANHGPAPVVVHRRSTHVIWAPGV